MSLLELKKDMMIYMCIDLITNKLERQVRKYKTRVNRKHRDRGDQDIFVAEVQESTTNNHADDIESEMILKLFVLNNSA